MGHVVNGQQRPLRRPPPQGDLAAKAGLDAGPLQRAGVEAGFGSEVTLWGRSSQGTLLPIDDVAHVAGTVGYELMCALAPRVPVVMAA